MRGVKILVALVVLALLGTIAYIGVVSRQSATAGVTQTSGRAGAVQREIDETSRIVNGHRR